MTEALKKFIDKHQTKTATPAALEEILSAFVREVERRADIRSKDGRNAYDVGCVLVHMVQEFGLEEER